MQGPFLRPYGRAATINFHLYEVDGINLRTDATVGTADLDIMIDEATETSCTNAATDEGQGYSLVLTAAEMTGQRITIYVVDAATKVWLDDVIVIETTNHPSAMHPNGRSHSGTAQSGTSTTITLAAAASSTNDIYLGHRGQIVAGTGVGESFAISGYVGSTKVATIIGTFPITPDSTSVYELLGDSITEVTIPTVAQIADGVMDEVLTSGHDVTGSLSVIVRDILVDTDYVNTLGVNVKSVNSVTVDGVGSDDDPWNPV